jgi:hypothetical protein
VIATSPMGRNGSFRGCDYRPKPLPEFVQNHYIALRAQVRNRWRPACPPLPHPTPIVVVDPRAQRKRRDHCSCVCFCTGLSICLHWPFYLPSLPGVCSSPSVLLRREICYCSHLRIEATRTTRAPPPATPPRPLPPGIPDTAANGCRTHSPHTPPGNGRSTSCR